MLYQEMHNDHKLWMCFAYKGWLVQFSGMTDNLGGVDSILFFTHTVLHTELSAG